MIVRMTKIGQDHSIDVKVPDDIGGEQEAKIRARRMLERDYPDVNQMEWEATLEGEKRE